MAIHRYLVYHAEAFQSHELITARYSCFNEHDSIKLEDWLTDIEMAADLTSESRARLAKVKSRGLTCTLGTEAITLNKSWDEIKNLL